MPAIEPSRPIRNATARRIGRTAGTSSDWRCSCCGKLLGVRRDGLMHLRFQRGHEYLVSYPATATCRDCGVLNHANSR